MKSKKGLITRILIVVAICAVFVIVMYSTVLKMDTYNKQVSDYEIVSVEYNNNVGDGTAGIATPKPKPEATATPQVTAKPTVKIGRAHV